MPVSYTSGQPSHFRRHPTCWASLQWSHNVSSTPCHGCRTSAPISAHPPTECKRSRHPFVPAAQHLISLSDNNNIRAGQWADCQWDAEFSSPTPAPPEWPIQEELGSRLTTSAPVSDVSAPACANGVWPPLRPMSVAQKNKPSTMLFSKVQSIDLPMDCMAWRCWTMRQLNGCSTPAPRSSAAKQWF